MVHETVRPKAIAIAMPDVLRAQPGGAQPGGAQRPRRRRPRAERQERRGRAHGTAFLLGSCFGAAKMSSTRVGSLAPPSRNYRPVPYRVRGPKLVQTKTLLPGRGGRAGQSASSKWRVESFYGANSSASANRGAPDDGRKLVNEDPRGRDRGPLQTSYVLYRALGVSQSLSAWSVDTAAPVGRSRSVTGVLLRLLP